MRYTRKNTLLKLFEQGPVERAVRILANHLVTVCPRCNNIPINEVFANARGIQSSFCWRCVPDRITAKFFLKSVIQLRDKKLQQFASNTLYTRSVIAWLRGIGKFGVSRPQPTLPPIAIVWNFTHRCNLKCLHCYQDSYSSLDAHSYPTELSTIEALKVVDIVTKSGCGSLSFSGGEPLIRDDFYDIAKHTSERGLLCTLSTNGTMIDHTIAKKLISSGVSGISISLDSLDSKFHDELRGAVGAHAKALRGIEVCAENGQFKELIIAVTLTNKNLKDIPGFIELASEIGATRLYISRILPVGRGKALRHLRVTPLGQRQVLKELATEFINYAKTGEGVAVMTRGMTYFAPRCAILSNYEIFPISEIVVGFEKRHEEILGSSAKKLFRQFAEYAGGCATGLTYCGLSPEGNILPCAPATDVHLGNILQDGLEKIWINNPVLRKIRDRSQVTGKCGRCTHNLICGGCRVTAYGETGDWLASDPSCPY
ncbi:MAG: radical SAM protein [Candidatus Heimdallarchaeota archaeon]|nr:MAG: radical SAM protein [Candidatus Heimdallarchaeota archaeon]